MRSALDAQVELLGLLGDVTRLRLLHVLSAYELTVGELTHATDLGQSRVSTHLGKLRDHRLVLDRRAGTRTYYRFNEPSMPEAARRLWQVLQGDVDDALVRHDHERAARLVQARAQHWPEALAGEMERHYSPGRTWDSLARALTGLLALGDVLDVGSGDGSVAELLAPHARSITCVDLRAPLLQAAGQRLAGLTPARLTQADMHALPYRAGSFHHVLCLNSLAHAHDPARTLVEACRVLKPAGNLVLVTLRKHAHQEVTREYGHRHPGFTPTWLRRQLEALGMVVTRCDVTSRERRRPHFQVITCFARRPEDTP